MRRRARAHSEHMQHLAGCVSAQRLAQAGRTLSQSFVKFLLSRVDDDHSYSRIREDVAVALSIRSVFVVTGIPKL